MEDSSPAEQTDALLGGVVHEVGGADHLRLGILGGLGDLRDEGVRDGRPVLAHQARRLVENRGALVKRGAGPRLVGRLGGGVRLVHLSLRARLETVLRTVRLGGVDALARPAAGRDAPFPVDEELVRPVGGADVGEERRGVLRHGARHASRAEKAERAESARARVRMPRPPNDEGGEPPGERRRKGRRRRARRDPRERGTRTSRARSSETVRGCVTGEEARGTTLRQNPRVGLFESHVLFRRIDQNVLTVCDLEIRPNHIPAFSQRVPRVFRRPFEDLGDCARAAQLRVKLLIDY